MIKGRYVTLAAALLLFLTSALSHHTLIKGREESFQKEVNTLKNLREKVSSVEEREVLDERRVEELRSSAQRVKVLKERLYTMEEFNEFVKDFEGIRGRYRGINKVSYEVMEDEQKASINLSFQDSYRNVRRFLHEIEMTFFFIDISYFKAEKEGRQIKGNFNIQVYFRSSHHDEG